MNKEDITVFVSVYNRPKYTEKSLQSLKDNWTGKVVIVDDASDQKTKDIIKKVKAKDWEVITNTENKHIENVIKMAADVRSKYVYITDNDVIYSSQFEEKLLEYGNLLEKKYKEGFLLSLFNSSNHQEWCFYRNVPQREVLLGLKNVFSTGGISMLTLPNYMRQWIERDIAINVTWDYRYCIWHQLAGVPIFRTKPSYVDHIGQFGVNSNTDRFDQADNFIE